ncbi:MAG: CsgG/HfaB family protein [Acidobacteriota bacterium]
MRKNLIFFEIIIPTIFFMGFASEFDVKIDPSVDFRKYKKVAVIEFEDAPESPHSGEEVSNIVASELKKKGFEVLERKIVKETLENLNIKKDEITESDLQKIQEALGVDAIVSGKVLMYQSKEAGGMDYYHRPADAKWAQFPTKNFFYNISFELKMLDSKTGTILMEAKDHRQEISKLNKIQDMTKNIIKGMFKKLPKIK